MGTACCTEQGLERALVEKSQVTPNSSVGSTAQAWGQKDSKGARREPSKENSLMKLRSKVQLRAARNMGNISDFYEFRASLFVEDGGIGPVRRARDRRTLQEHVVKSIAKVAKTGVASRHSEEVEMMSMVDHPNIVRVHETFEDKKKVYIVMEFCEGGMLLDRLCDEGNFTEIVAIQLVKQMLLAVNYLHHSGVALRDVKPQSWLFEKKSVPLEASTLKLIDFGFSQRIANGRPLQAPVGLTPTPYHAPEVTSSSANEKVDIWSVGVICHLLLSGTLPFDDGAPGSPQGNQGGLRQLLMEDGPWKDVSGKGKAFVRALLKEVPGDRPTAESALQLEWCSGAAKDLPGASITQLEVNHLRAFTRAGNLKKAALTVIATQLDNKRIAELKSMFISLDKNRDGTLSAAEISAAFSKAGVEIPKDLEELFKLVDTDQSGSVDYTEFLASTMSKKLYHQQDVVWRAFRKFDKDGSGAIDKTELANVLCDPDVQKVMHFDNDGSSKVDAMFKETDTDGNGLIDFDEFFVMMGGDEGA